MNERKILKLVAELISEYLAEEPEKPKTETGDLSMPVPLVLEKSPENVIIEAPEQPKNVMEAKEPVENSPQPLHQHVEDLEIKNKEIERLKEELAKAQMNHFNFQPIGGSTNG